VCIDSSDDDDDVARPLGLGRNVDPRGLGFVNFFVGLRLHPRNGAPNRAGILQRVHARFARYGNGGRGRGAFL
jgi:hypothetical protein